MKICFWGKIANALLGNTYGGGELQIALLAKALTKLGHEVFVIDLDISAPFVTKEGIKVFPVKGYNDGLKMFRTFTHRLPALYKAFLEVNADVYYCRIREYRHILVYLVARKLKAKFVLALASDLDVLSIAKRWRHFYSSNVKDLWGVLNGIMGEIVYPFLLRKADLVLVQHEGQKEILLRRGISARVFYNLIDPGDLERKTASNNSDSFVYVGSLDKRKGFKDFFELARRTPEQTYKVIGKVRDNTGDRLYQKLRSFQNVKLLGKLSHTDTLNEISSSKALISTSPMEGFPNIFIEAWGCGIPVLSLFVDPGGVVRKNGLGYVAGGKLDKLIDYINKIDPGNDIGIKAKHYVNRYHVLTNERMMEIDSVFTDICN